jgi:hypothetical protein
VGPNSAKLAARPRSSISSRSAAAEAGDDLVQAVVIEARPWTFRHRMWSGSNLSVEVTAPRGVSRRLCTSCLPASLPVRGADHCGGCVDLNTGRTSRISSPSMSTSATKYSRTGTLPSTSACSRCWYRSHAVLSGLLRGCGTASGQAVIEQLDELIDVSTGDVHGGEIRMTLPTIRPCRCDPRPVRGAATAPCRAHRR